jgi:hypothetical protein
VEATKKTKMVVVEPTHTIMKPTPIVLDLANTHVKTINEARPFMKK